MGSLNTLTETVVAKDGIGGTINVTSNVVQGDTLLDISRDDIPAGAVNLEIDVSITAANITGVAIGCARSSGTSTTANINLTVKTNSTSAPSDTFTGITPTNGICWTSGDTTACPITADVTKLYVTNSGNGVATFQFKCLQHNVASLPA